jgi:hypothetical protein
MKLISVIFIFMFFAASPSFARNDCRALADSLKAPFLKTWAEDYYPLMCSDNVLELKTNLLAEHLKLENKDKVVLENAYVVVIRHKAAPYLEVVPQMPRLTFKDQSYLPPRWSFHVFLVVDGLVFDMDFTDAPKAIGLDTYMRTMWDQNKISEYVVQLKSLDEYVTKDTFGTFSNADVIPAGELVDKLSDLTCNLSKTINF